MLTKLPSKEDVKNSVSTSNLHAAPGTDGLTSYLYHHCWDTLGDALTEVVQATHGGEPPTYTHSTHGLWLYSRFSKTECIHIFIPLNISLLHPTEVTSNLKGHLMIFE